MRRWLFILLWVFIIYKYWFSPEHTHTHTHSSTVVSTSFSPNKIYEDPIQEEVKNMPLFQKNGYLIKPMASFQVCARVLSSHLYPPESDKEADLAPVDLALGWGPMANPATLDKIQISQSGRFYYWFVNEFPIPQKEIETHSANMHMIPANQEVEEQLNEIQKGEIVEISGYLVNVSGDNGYQWHSSLTRNDTGYGACEVIWVEKVNVR